MTVQLSPNDRARAQRVQRQCVGATVSAARWQERRRWWCAGALTVALWAAGAGARAAPAPGEVNVGETLREATLRGLNGPTRSLSAFRGRPLIINVWASWCGPCRQEMASLERMAWQDGPAAVPVIGISTDDDIDAAKAFLRQSNATINHFIDRQLELETMLGASRLPLTVFVDARGRVLHKVYGSREWDDAESRALVAKAFGRR
jgi:thiol-disulfide isomerase/thioredoxin